MLWSTDVIAHIKQTGFPNLNFEHVHKEYMFQNLERLCNNIRIWSFVATTCSLVVLMLSFKWLESHQLSSLSCDGEVLGWAEAQERQTGLKKQKKNKRVATNW